MMVRQHMNLYGKFLVIIITAGVLLALNNFIMLMTYEILPQKNQRRQDIGGNVRKKGFLNASQKKLSTVCSEVNGFSSMTYDEGIKWYRTYLSEKIDGSDNQNQIPLYYRDIEQSSRNFVDFVILKGVQKKCGHFKN